MTKTSWRLTRYSLRGLMLATLLIAAACGVYVTFFQRPPLANVPGVKMTSWRESNRDANFLFTEEVSPRTVELLLRLVESGNNLSWFDSHRRVGMSSGGDALLYWDGKKFAIMFISERAIACEGPISREDAAKLIWVCRHENSTACDTVGQGYNYGARLVKHPGHSQCPDNWELDPSVEQYIQERIAGVKF